MLVTSALYMNQLIFGMFVLTGIPLMIKVLYTVARHSSPVCSSTSGKRVAITGAEVL